MTEARAPRLHHRAQHYCMPGRLRCSISCGLRDLACPCRNPIYHDGTREDRGGGDTRFGRCGTTAKDMDGAGTHGGSCDGSVAAPWLKAAGGRRRWVRPCGACAGAQQHRESAYVGASATSFIDGDASSLQRLNSQLRMCQFQTKTKYFVKLVRIDIVAV
jgi:hypothetical protein